MLFPRKQRLRPAHGSVDTKQRLRLQGYLIVNKSCQEGSNHCRPGTPRLSCEHSRRCGTGSAGWANPDSPFPGLFLQLQITSKTQPHAQPTFTCQGFKHPTKFLTTLKPFLLSVCFHFTCSNSWCSVGPFALEHRTR